MIDPPAIQPLKVASYNIHRCIGTDRKYNPDRIVAVIRELGADIIGLQEVDSRLLAGAGMYQLDYISTLTRLKSIAGPCIEEERGCYGNALLTRLPVSAFRLIDLSISGREPRGAVDVDLRTAAGTIRFIVTHLGRNGAERFLQAKRLIRFLGDVQSSLTLIAGDFNEWFPLSRTLRLLYRHFGRAPLIKTFPSLLPVFALDRIWSIPPGRLSSLQRHNSRLAWLASDHLPIKAEVHLQSGRF